MEVLLPCFVKTGSRPALMQGLYCPPTPKCNEEQTGNPVGGGRGRPGHRSGTCGHPYSQGCGIGPGEREDPLDHGFQRQTPQQDLQVVQEFQRPGVRA